VLHGAPGSGKSSFIKALAGYFKTGIGIINLQAMNDNNLDVALSTSPEGNFILIEDFDSTKSTKSRTGIDKKDIKRPVVMSNTEPPVIDVSDKTLTLSSILNALDGVVSLDGTIIFMTTNVLENIDSAILRPGRVDHIYELGKLQHKEVCEYIALMFTSNTINSDVTFEDIMGCDLQKLYFEHRNSFDDFVAVIPKKYIS
jgi:chaperone BCS1